MATAFDDLLPSKPAGGEFGDLVPKSSFEDLTPVSEFNDLVPDVGRDAFGSKLSPAPAKTLGQHIREALSPLLGETANQTAERIGGSGVKPIGLEEMFTRYGVPRTLLKVASTVTMQGPAALAQQGGQNLVRGIEGKPPVSIIRPGLDTPLGADAGLGSLGPHVATPADASLPEQVAGAVAHGAGALPGFVAGAEAISPLLRFPEAVRIAAAKNALARMLTRAASAGIVGGAAAAAEGQKPSEIMKAAAATAPLGPLGAIENPLARAATFGTVGAAVPLMQGGGTPEAVGGAVFNSLLALMTHGGGSIFSDKFAIPVSEVNPRTGEPVIDVKTGQPATKPYTGADLAADLKAELVNRGVAPADAEKTVDLMGRYTEQGLPFQAQAAYLDAIHNAAKPVGETVAKQIGTTAGGETGPTPAGPGDVPSAPPAAPPTPGTGKPVGFEQLVPSWAEVDPAIAAKSEAGRSLLVRAKLVDTLVKRNSPNAATEADKLETATRAYLEASGQKAPELTDQHTTDAFKVERAGELVHLTESGNPKPIRTVIGSDAKAVVDLRREADERNAARSFDNLSMQLLGPDEIGTIGIAQDTGSMNRGAVKGVENALQLEARRRAVNLLRQTGVVNVSADEETAVLRPPASDTRASRAVRANLAGFLVKALDAAQGQLEGQAREQDYRKARKQFFADNPQASEEDWQASLPEAFDAIPAEKRKAIDAESPRPAPTQADRIETKLDQLLGQAPAPKDPAEELAGTEQTVRRAPSGFYNLKGEFDAAKIADRLKVDPEIARQVAAKLNAEELSKTQGGDSVGQETQGQQALLNNSEPIPATSGGTVQVQKYDAAATAGAGETQPTLTARAAAKQFRQAAAAVDRNTMEAVLGYFSDDEGVDATLSPDGDRIRFSDPEKARSSHNLTSGATTGGAYQAFVQWLLSPKAVAAGIDPRTAADIAKMRAALGIEAPLIPDSRNTPPEPPATQPVVSPPAAPTPTGREADLARLRQLLGGGGNVVKEPSPGDEAEIQLIGARLALSHVADGVTEFEDFARKMKADLPDLWDSFKGKLRGWWEAAAEKNPKIQETTRAETNRIIEKIDQQQAPASPMVPASAERLKSITLDELLKLSPEERAALAQHAGTLTTAEIVGSPLAIAANEYIKQHGTLKLSPLAMDQHTGIHYRGNEVPKGNFQYPPEERGRDRILWIIMGQPGGGKSSVMAKELQKQLRAFVADSDWRKPFLPGFENGLGAYHVHGVSAAVNRRALEMALEDGQNVVYPTVGDSLERLDEWEKYAKERGYTVKFGLVAIEPDESFRRTFGRFVAGGQGFIPFSFIERVGLTPDENWRTLAARRDEGTDDNYKGWSNQVPRGHQPIPLPLPEATGSGSRGSGSPSVRGGGSTPEPDTASGSASDAVTTSPTSTAAIRALLRDVASQPKQSETNDALLARHDRETLRYAAMAGYLSQVVGSGKIRRYALTKSGAKWVQPSATPDQSGGTAQISPPDLLTAAQQSGKLEIISVGAPEKPKQFSGKEPWQLTQKQFIDEVRAGRDFPQLGVNPTPLSTLRAAKDWQRLDKQAAHYHEAQVVNAAAVHNKDVPDEVLQAYPSLKADLKRRDQKDNPPAPPTLAVTPDDPALVPGTMALIDAMHSALLAGRSTNNPALDQLAEDCFGSSKAAGKWTSADAYDAVEAALNKYLMDEAPKQLAAVNGDRRAMLAWLRKVVGLLPRQTSRTAEKDAFQQFSTPPTEAYLAVEALEIKPGDVFLEPSGGVGSLALWAKLFGATVHVNEIAPRRAALLKAIGFDNVTMVDGEKLHDLLDPSIRPTVIGMNPPFSATGGRVAKNKTAYGAKHVEQALWRLADGGRLVAIVGEGMGLDKPRFSEWWQKMAGKYTVRANIGIPGEEYGKFGTTFGNQLLIFDKIGPTPGVDWKAKLENIIHGRTENLESALANLERVPDRRDVAPSIPTSVPGNDLELGLGQVPASPDDGRPAPAGGSPSGGGVGSGKGGAGGSDGGSVQAGAPEGAATPASPEPGPRSPEPAGSGAVSGGAGGAANVRATGSVAATQAPENNPRVDEEGGAFVKYKPSVNFGAKGHPADLVESASLAAVEPVPISAKISEKLVERARDTGMPSDVQLEATALTEQRHGQTLPGGQRAAIAVGAGTGVGKGIVLASGMANAYHQHGVKRFLWLSCSNDLIESSARDLKDVGLGFLPLQQLNEFGADDKIAAKMDRGVMFATYSTLIAKSKKGGTRLQQLVDWLGNDGYVVFDEGHKAANALAGVLGQPTQTGLAVMQLQDLLPKARVVYSSATQATEARHLAYMPRLGLWGKGTQFANVQDFINELRDPSVMEQVARDMKALGTYWAPMISYQGVTYGSTEHALTKDQERMQNAAADAWQAVLQNIDEAMGLTNGGAWQRMRALSVFWSSNQRFWRTVLAGFKMPTVIAKVEAFLADNMSVVVALEGTAEARTKELVTKATAAGEDLESLDFTPRETLGAMIEAGFPTQLFEDQTDPATGQTIKVPVKDAQGNFVHSQEALALKQKLLDSLSDLQLPDNPLDQLRTHFGENFAEISGRKKVLQRNRVTGKVEYVKRAAEGVPAHKVNTHEAQRFMDGKARVAAVTPAGSVGITLHSWRRAKNQQRRAMVYVELPWSATVMVQKNGRVHRSDLALGVQPPHFEFVFTNAGGEKRFVSSAMRRMAQLGSLSRGERTGYQEAGNLSDFNLETQWGEAALSQFYSRILSGGTVPGLENPRQALRDMGILKPTKTGEDMDKDDRTNVTRFLNRVLALPLKQQNALFDYFSSVFDQVQEFAKANGLFDTGVNEIRGTGIRIDKPPTVVATDPTSGATTKHIELAVTNPTQPTRWDDVSKMEFYQNNKSGNIVATERMGQITDPRTGTIINRYRLHRPNGRTEIITAQELRDRFQSTGTLAARNWWSKELERLPKFETRTHHVIAGALLPIWRRLQTEKGQKLRIVRAKTDDGQRVVGVEIPAGAVRQVLQQIGVKQAGSRLETPAQVSGAVLHGEPVNLVGGLTLRRGKIGGEDVIRVEGAQSQDFQALRDAGLLNERKDFKQVFWVPSDGARHETVLGKLLDAFPVVESGGGAVHETGPTYGASAVDPQAILSYVDAVGITDPGKKAEAQDGISRALQQLAETAVGGANAPYSQSLFNLGDASPAPAATAVADKPKFSEAERLFRQAEADAIRGDPAAQLRVLEKKNTISALLPALVNREIPRLDLVGLVVNTPADVHAALIGVRSPYFESFKVLVLSDDNIVVASRIITVGTLNASLVDPNQIKAVVDDVNAATGKKYNRVILAHNHPSADPTPSSEDISITKRVNSALGALGIEIVDHVVTDGDRYSSLVELGLHSPMSTSERGSRAPKALVKKLAPPLPVDGIGGWELVNRRTDLQSISQPDLVEKVIRPLRQADPNAGHVLYLNTRNKLQGLERIPNIKALSSDKLMRIIATGANREGALSVIVDLSPFMTDMPTSEMIAFAKRLRKLGELLNVTVLDGVGLSTHGKFSSLKELGVYEKPPTDGMVKENPPTDAGGGEPPAPPPTTTAASPADDWNADRYRIEERDGRLWVVDARTGKTVKPGNSLYSGSPAERERLQSWVDELNKIAAVDQIEADEPGTVAGVSSVMNAANDGVGVLPKDPAVKKVVDRIKGLESAAATALAWAKNDTADRWIGVKRLLGQPHEFLSGNTSGEDIWHLKKLFDATSQLAKERVLAEWGVRFLKPEVADVLRKIPYLDEGKIAAIARTVLQIPMLAKNMGIPQSRQKLLFRAAEAVRGFKPDGTPILGVLLDARDLAAGWRYTPDEAAALWGQLNDQERGLVKLWDQRRRELADREGLGVSLEGYMRRYHENDGSVQRLVEQLKSRGPLAQNVAGFRKERKGAPGWMEDFQRAVVQREIESELERRHNDFVTELEQMIARPIPPQAGQEVFYGQTDDGEPRRFRLEKIEDDGTMTLREQGQPAIRVPVDQAPLVRLANGAKLYPGQLRDGEITTRRESGPFAGEMVAVDSTTFEWFKEFLQKDNPAARGAFSQFLWGKAGPGGFVRNMLAFWKLNQLSLALGTAGTNAISNAIFHAAMTSNDFFKATAKLVTAPKEVRAAFGDVWRDLAAPFMALTPGGIRRSPPSLYGAKAPGSIVYDAGLMEGHGGLLGMRDELLGGRPGTVSRGFVHRAVDTAGGLVAGAGAGGLVGGAPGAVVGAAGGAVFGMAKTLELGMVPFQAIENYVRRLTYLARMQNQDPHLVEKILNGTADPEAIRQLNRVFDSIRIYQIDYGATPLFMKKLGEGTVPFMRYIYGYARQVSNQLPLGKNKDAATRFAGILTLLAMAYLLTKALEWATTHGQKPTVGKGQVDENAPGQFQANGRQFVGRAADGREAFVRTTKYPYLNLMPLMKGMVEDARRGQFKDVPAELQTLGQEGISPGPGLQGMAWAFGYKQPYDAFKSPAEIGAEDLAGFVPFHRLNEYRNQLAQARADGGTMYVTKPKGFWANLESSLPPELHPVGPSDPGQRVVNQQTSEFVQLKPGMEALKQWTGINLRLIDPADYQLWEEGQREKGLKLDTNQDARLKKYVVDRTLAELPDLGKSRAYLEAVYDTAAKEASRQGRAEIAALEKKILTGAVPAETVDRVAAALAGRNPEVQKEIAMLLLREGVPPDQNLADAKVLLRQRLIQAFRQRVEKTQPVRTIRGYQEALQSPEQNLQSVGARD